MSIARLPTLTILVFILASAAAAQDRAARNVLVQTSDGTNTSHSFGFDGSSAPTASGFAPTVSTPTVPNAPSAHRVIDKKFVSVVGVLGGAEAMRFTSRQLVLENELAAGAPWVTHVPTNQNLVSKYAGLYAAELVVAYEIKKPHAWLPGDRIIRKFWWAYPAAMAGIHIKNGIGNIRTQGPGGCTSIECEMQMQQLQSAALPGDAYNR